MFERFTDRARRVVVLAQEESRLLGHDHIGTEHILLGLIGETDGLAARALTALEVDLDDTRRRVEEIIGHGPGRHAGHIPFTPRAKKVLELSLREALQLGHNYIGTEHILLGLLREGEGVACRVLMAQGVTLAIARQEVIGLVVSETREEAKAAGGESGRTRSRRPPSAEQVRPAARLRRQEGEPERMPVCPRCDADLTESLRYRVQDTPHRPDDEGPTRRASVLFCAECGRVIASNLLDPDEG